MLPVPNLNVEEELYRALRSIVGRKRLLRTTRRVIVHYAIKWAHAHPRTTDAEVRRIVAKQVWPMLEIEHAEARVKTTITQYGSLVRPLISALLNAATTIAIMKRVLLIDTARAARALTLLPQPRTLADARRPLR